MPWCSQVFCNETMCKKPQRRLKQIDERWANEGMCHHIMMRDTFIKLIELQRHVLECGSGLVLRHEEIMNHKVTKLFSGTRMQSKMVCQGFLSCIKPIPEWWDYDGMLMWQDAGTTLYEEVKKERVHGVTEVWEKAWGRRDGAGC